MNHFDDCRCNLCKQANPELPPHADGCVCIICNAERDAERRRAFWSIEDRGYGPVHLPGQPEPPAIKDAMELAQAAARDDIKMADAIELATIDIQAKADRFDPEGEVAVTLKRADWQCVMWACCQESDYYEQADAILDQVGCDHDWREVVTSRKTFERCDLCGLTR